MLEIATFDDTLCGLGIAPNRAVFDELVAAYSAPDRHYHGERHIAECLAALSAHTDLAQRRHEIAIALWFHDAIYDTRRDDNEERSARRAKRFLHSAGAAVDAIDRVHQLIMVTKHTAAVIDPDEQLLVDIDLGILGQPARAFAAYDAAIRREYAWVPEDRYRSGRGAVLRSLLDRPRIYHTDRFFKLYEARARENIAAAIAKLEQRS